jgi:hypothetical protein
MPRMRPRALVPLSLAWLCASIVLGPAGCGGGSAPPTASPTAAPTAAPTPTPAPTPLACSPTPPPLYGIQVKVFDDSGFRKILDSKPQVINVDDYCQRVGLGGGFFCFTRPEGHPQQAACDAMAVGRALDTGRDGPTWYWNDALCTSEGETMPGCRNNPNNQFLVIAKGDGKFEACAAPDAPLSQDPVRPGSPCGACWVQNGVGCR